jgi:hypothetical protein
MAGFQRHFPLGIAKHFGHKRPSSHLLIGRYQGRELTNKHRIWMGQMNQTALRSRM